MSDEDRVAGVEDRSATESNGRTLELVKRVKDHWAIAGSAAYVVLVALGMYQDCIYYNSFGINIIMFSEPGDFLLAPFKYVRVLISLATMAVVFLPIYVLVDRVTRAFKIDYRSPLAAVVAVVIVLASPFIITRYTGKEALSPDNFKAGGTSYFILSMKDDPKTERPIPYYLIGLNSNYAFLYERIKGGNVHVVRVSEIRSLTRVFGPLPVNVDAPSTPDSNEAGVCR